MRRSIGPSRSGQIGLYQAGADAEIDRAIEVWPGLDAFFAESTASPEAAFQRLAQILGYLPAAAPETPPAPAS